MASLLIPEPTYKRLVQAAAARNTTPEALAISTLDQLAIANGTSHAMIPPDSAAERLRNFDAWINGIHARPPLYPPGHEVDVSRDSIYKGCGE
jgi:hypothetical protein